MSAFCIYLTISIMHGPRFFSSSVMLGGGVIFVHRLCIFRFLIFVRLLSCYGCVQGLFVWGRLSKCFCFVESCVVL